MLRVLRPQAACLVCVLLLLGSATPASAQLPAGQNWTHVVRIGAYSLTGDNADEIVRSATASHVFGIEVDNDITGRYESLLDATGKLKAIRRLAEKAHAANNRAFVYIAGTECITANAAKTPHSLAKDHPDWLQRKLTGEPAIFGGGTAFWIAPGDEDVWISPYATEWRKLYMERVRQIAATGIDGIYVDIPYWMTHFEGWEDSWASFDDYTVAAFRRQTGLDARQDLKLGDFSDSNFRKWVAFRIQTLTDFLHDIDANAKSVNPQIMTIPEIYPGIEQEAVRVGADVYRMYPVVDAIAHEYEFGGGDHMASSRTPLDWFQYQVGMHSFRAFAQGKATWILNYSWDGDPKVDPRSSMMNLAMSQVMAGVNFWDAQGHVMSGSNDLPTRTAIFRWIEEHQKTFYLPRKPMRPVGVYFSPATRDSFPREFLRSYQGVLILLMQRHLEFQVVTPRTLAEFQGETLVLPDVRSLDDTERSQLQAFISSGRTLVVTGNDPTSLPAPSRVVRFADCPGKAYLAALEKDFGKASPELQSVFLADLGGTAVLSVQASPGLATNIARVDGKAHIFLANFRGLRGGENSEPIPETGVRITTTESAGTAYFLPFLGQVQPLLGKREGSKTLYELPPIPRGAVVWFEPK